MDPRTAMPAIMTTMGTLASEGGDALARYASVVIPLIEAAGGTVLARGTFRESLVGDDAPQFIAVMRFPNAESVHAMMSSAAYRAAIPDRELAFRDLRTFISDPL
jgi:uncharacterized protein (DUF1330 family)